MKGSFSHFIDLMQSNPFSNRKMFGSKNFTYSLQIVRHLKILQFSLPKKVMKSFHFIASRNISMPLALPKINRRAETTEQECKERRWLKFNIERLWIGSSFHNLYGLSFHDETFKAKVSHRKFLFCYLGCGPLLDFAI